MEAATRCDEVVERGDGGSYTRRSPARRTRGGVLAESGDQPHLVETLDGVVRRLGGATPAWRFERMATVCHRGTGEAAASFAQVARHHHVAVRV